MRRPAGRSSDFDRVSRRRPLARERGRDHAGREIHVRGVRRRAGVRRPERLPCSESRTMARAGSTIPLQSPSRERRHSAGHRMRNSTSRVAVPPLVSSAWRGHAQHVAARREAARAGIRAYSRIRPSCPAAPRSNVRRPPSNISRPSSARMALEMDTRCGGDGWLS